MTRASGTWNSYGYVKSLSGWVITLFHSSNQCAELRKMENRTCKDSKSEKSTLLYKHAKDTVKKC